MSLLKGDQKKVQISLSKIDIEFLKKSILGVSKQSTAISKIAQEKKAPTLFEVKRPK